MGSGARTRFGGVLQTCVSAPRREKKGTRFCSETTRVYPILSISLDERQVPPPSPLLLMLLLMQLCCFLLWYAPVELLSPFDTALCSDCWPDSPQYINCSTTCIAYKIYWVQEYGCSAVSGSLSALRHHKRSISSGEELDHGWKMERCRRTTVLAK